MRGTIAGAPRRTRRRRGENDALVLDLIARCNRPPSAYEISASAAARGISLVPNQVYRTLARLIEEGRVMRIEALNAYALREAEDVKACLVCLECQSVVTVAAQPAEKDLERAAANSGFHLRTGTVEARGICLDCASGSAERQER